MLDGGWVCHVEQGHYGHRARKATWLYALGVVPPSLVWGRSSVVSWNPARAGIVETLGKRECNSTPIEFRDVLLDMARSAVRGAAA
jgi:hypothetical protein